MIGFFPDPYPDELLYSVLARFQARAGYLPLKALVRHMFAADSAIPVLEVPHRIQILVSLLPPGHWYTVESLIQGHTIMPLLQPFMQPDRVQRLITHLRSSDRSKTRIRYGFQDSSVPLPKWLRFCPVCLTEDQERFGEPYWHRTHQVPGVEVCPVHGVFLAQVSRE